jgi:hypothetical protein
MTVFDVLLVGNSQPNHIYGVGDSLILCATSRILPAFKCSFRTLHKIPFLSQNVVSKNGRVCIYTATFLWCLTILPIVSHGNLHVCKLPCEFY